MSRTNKFKMGNRNPNINTPIFGEREDLKEKDNQNEFQKQKQADEQLVKQKISQEYTADIFGKALSSAEHYSSRFGKKSIKNMQFNYYNLFDSGITKNKEELKKAIIAFLDILQTYYQIDGKCFPSGIKINEVKAYLTSLKANCANPEDQKIYDSFISVINGQWIDFSGFFNTEKAVVDPNVLATKGIQALKSAGRQENSWEKKALDQGNYDVGLKLGKNWTDNQNYSNFNSNYEDFTNK